MSVNAFRLGIIVLVLVGVAGVGFLTWWQSTGNVAAIDARAAKLGVATNAAHVGPDLHETLNHALDELRAGRAVDVPSLRQTRADLMAHLLAEPPLFYVSFRKHYDQPLSLISASDWGLRFARDDLLSGLLDAVEDVRAGDPAAILRALRSREVGRPPSPWRPGSSTVAMVRHIVAASVEVDVTSITVIDALCDPDHWPVDPTDPTGKAVRRRERDGRLIGFWLCGANGIDDGGDPTRDHYTSLESP